MIKINIRETKEGIIQKRSRFLFFHYWNTLYANKDIIIEWLDDCIPYPGHIQRKTKHTFKKGDVIRNMSRTRVVKSNDNFYKALLNELKNEKYSYE